MKPHPSRQSVHCVVLFSLCLLSVLVSPAQDCASNAANKPSILIRSKDEVESPTGKMNPAEMTKMKPHLVKAESWIKNLLSGFKGAKLQYYNSYFPDFVGDGSTHEFFHKATGLKSYYSGEMMFFAYFCYENNNTIFTEGESGSNVQVIFNDIFIHQFTNDEGIHTINGRPAFRVILKKTSEDRIDFYEEMGHNNSNSTDFIATDYILLRNSDKPVFIPVTRKQYLERLLAEIDTTLNREVKFLKEANESSRKVFEAAMKNYKELDKHYSPETEANRRQKFVEDQERQSTAYKRISADADAAKDVVREYLEKPAEWLDLGFRSFYSNSFTARGVSEFLERLDDAAENDPTQYEVVTINPAYYNSRLSADVPQLIMVISQNAGYAHMLQVQELIKQPDALAPLQALLKTQ